jgi:two-component system, LytTR family, response regulator
MNTFRALVVDDEPLAREVVVDLLRRDAEIVGVTETGDPGGVSTIVSAEQPDLIFLDIEMPGLTGIQLAASITGELPVIVFVTAFSHYALDAFGVEATDYLLKPFSDERFYQALDRAKRRVRERRAGPVEQPAKTKEFVKKLAIGYGAQTQWIDVADVLWIEAEDYCVLVHTRHGRHLLRASMSSLEERLDPRWFVRSHRAAIVNMREVTHLESDGAALQLSDGTHIAISRSRRPAVERIIAARLGRPP